ncbi:hypothetical protein [Rickettsiella endosymbiont of Aleochara curtula]|uniref:hypothetical protein n=1 Tax=Rickettsiella endosymbiont of Aleochara curtula TaxID=3077936 RepID=UPI00313C4729
MKLGFKKVKKNVHDHQKSGNKFHPGRFNVDTYMIFMSILMALIFPAVFMANILAAPMGLTLAVLGCAVLTAVCLTAGIKYFSQFVRNLDGKDNLKPVSKEKVDFSLSQNERNTNGYDKENAMTHAAKNSDNSSKISFFSEVVKNDNPVQNQPAPMSPSLSN